VETKPNLEDVSSGASFLHSILSATLYKVAVKLETDECDMLLFEELVRVLLKSEAEINSLREVQVSNVKKAKHVVHPKHSLLPNPLNVLRRTTDKSHPDGHLSPRDQPKTRGRRSRSLTSCTPENHKEYLLEQLYEEKQQLQEQLEEFVARQDIKKFRKSLKLFEEKVLEIEKVDHLELEWASHRKGI